MSVKALFLITLVIISVGVTAYVSQLPAEDSPASLRNIGRSQYEEEKYDEAAKSFERILSIDPNSALDHLNLGIVLVQMEKFPEAREHLKKAEALDASLAAHGAYNLALSYKRERNFAEAAKEFERVIQVDPQNPDAVYNLAVVYEGLGQLPKAFELASKSVELLPDEVAPHYRRMMLAVRLGKLDIANQEKTKMSELRAQDARNRTPAELEMSVYTEIVEPDRSGLSSPVDSPRPSGVKFKDIADSVGLKTGADDGAGGQVSWVDLDGDGRQDLAVVLPRARPSLRLWVNRPEGFKPLALPRGLDAENPVLRVGWGDLDHDGDQDLCVALEGRILTFLNDGTGNLVQKSESKTAAGVADLLVVDFDHDGDLDVYAALIGVPPVMLQNDGQGNLAVLENETGLAAGGRSARRLVAVDFDDDNDTDFFLAHEQGPNSLLSNLRVGTFRDIAASLATDQPSGVVYAASADLNNDVWPDLVLTDKEGAVTALMGQKTGKFQRVAIAAAGGGAGALELFDVDNDGDEDILAGTRLLQNDGKFTDFTQAYELALTAPAVSAKAEDFDQDGDYDLAVLQEDGVLRLLRNDGGNRNGWLRVTLEGLQSNRFGVGTKVEIRENSFFQRKISEGRPLLFGLGQYKAVDVLRMWWPTGVAQNILAPSPGQDNPVREKLGPPSSCPYIYVWNGREFEFFTDVLDATALGVPLGDGNFWPHADKEDLLIPGSLLKEKDGELLIQMIGELREVVYLDRLELTAIDHPADVAVVPLDAAGVPSDGHSRLVEISKRVLPRRARDEKGNDLTRALESNDRRYAQGFKLTRFNGLAETHGLLLEFDIPAGLARPVLALTGWVNWIDGDTLYALGGGAGPAPFGPRVEIRVDGGRWRVLTESPGLPPGIGKTLLVPLPGEIVGHNAEVRITTNMEVYWDSAAVAQSQPRVAGGSPLRVQTADLHFRGFSRLDRKTADSPPWYDYRTVSATAPWKGQRGFFTRYGDVIDLLRRSDDRLVVFGPGDELTLRFGASASPPPSGWVRDYVLRVDGWIKDANSTTHRGDTVEPLPYRRMASYPPEKDKPLSDKHYWETIDAYNNRTLR